MLVALLAAACSSGAAETDEVGATCKVAEGTVCRGQNLQSVSLVATNLRGADFSGSDLTTSDFRDADLTGAKFVGSVLSGVNFTGANLRDADLSKATLYFTNFTDADLRGVNRAGAFDCNTTRPDGALVEGACERGPSPVTPSSTGKAVTGPPTIEYFRLVPPGTCVNDAEGIGIDVEWSTRNATGLTFAVDGLRIDSANKARGSKHLPFICDGKPHTVTMEALGPLPPLATATFTKSLEETAAVPPVG